MSERPSKSRSKFRDGRPIAMDSAASPTYAVSMKPPVHAIAVPTSSAASPIGMLPGSRTPETKPMKMIAKTGRATQRVLHMFAAGFIAMNVTEMPASVPSRAARGVYFRTIGPMNAPMRTMTPMMNAHARPAPHAAMGSFVASYVGSITTNVTMNMCGTDGP